VAHIRHELQLARYLDLPGSHHRSWTANKSNNRFAQHPVAYRGIYTGHLCIEEVAPSVGRNIAAKIDKRPKSGLRCSQELPVCGAHRLPGSERNLVAGGSCGPSVKNKQSGANFAWLLLGSTRRRVLRGPAWQHFSSFSEVTSLVNTVYTMEQR
jgi:hypothetical protein